jgi:hypothetical protein
MCEISTMAVHPHYLPTILVYDNLCSILQQGNAMVKQLVFCCLVQQKPMDESMANIL